jgi:N-acylneuraminate cytidylyltransferase
MNNMDVMQSSALVPFTALVPAKGISVRVPGKNLRLFCGKPLIYYILYTLNTVEYIERIVVNTDSNNIAGIAEKFSKVLIHQRPAHLCGHSISMNQILAYDINLLGPGHYLQTHATNPMLLHETILNAINLYLTSINTYDSLVSVIKHQSRFFNVNMQPINHNPSILINTQDLEPIYEENSCLYIFSDTSFFNSENRIGKRFQLYPISKIESLDIDTEDDFQLAETAWKTFRE